MAKNECNAFKDRQERVLWRAGGRGNERKQWVSEWSGKTSDLKHLINVFEPGFSGIVKILKSIA